MSSALQEDVDTEHFFLSLKKMARSATISRLLPDSVDELLDEEGLLQLGGPSSPAGSGLDI